MSRALRLALEHAQRRARVPPIVVCLDSNDRFQDDYQQRAFWALPHDDNGFNRLHCRLVDGWIYWRDCRVLHLADFPGFRKDRGYFSAFVCAEGDEPACWVREPLNFGGHLITNSWVCIYTNPKESFDVYEFT